MADHACPSCAFPIQAGHRFCPSCGAALAPERLRAPSEAAADLARVQGAVGSGFRVVGLLGRGGFAEVFEAQDLQLRRRVAIKVIRPDVSVRAEAVERFQREARAIAAIRHPNIVEVYAVGGGEEVAWFVMPLIEGESLGARLKREGQLPVDEARRILVAAAGALMAAHRAGLVHRDVKPDNVLLDGTERRVLLTDFGIAKALGEGDSSLTRSGLLVGTPQFMSPEQAAGDPVDHRSDVYALGVVGYRMLAGRLPFDGTTTQSVLAKILTQEPEPLWAVRPDCPRALVSAVGRALAKDPGERWEDMPGMLEVLEGRRPPPPVGKRAGVSGWDRPVGEEGISGGTASALPAARFRRVAAVAGLAVAILAVADVMAGLGGISAWVALVAAATLALGAGRLWREGFAWADLLRGAAPLRAHGGVGGTSLPGTGEEDFGRHRSLVHTSVKARAAVLKAYSLMPQQERARLPDVQETVEHVAARVRHLARKVVTLEERIGEASHRVEDLGASPPETSDSRVLSRAQGQVRELASARDEANEALRRVVGLLRELEEAFTVWWLDDPVAAAQEVVRILATARAELTA